MKKTISCVLFAFCALCFESNAMKTYTVHTSPPMKFVQANGYIIKDGTSSSSFNMICDTYNNARLYAPISIAATMTQEEIIASLAKSFSVRVTAK